MITVVAAVIECESRVLICQRRRDKAFPLKWEFPGGKVEAGESLETALAREIKEELGIGVEIGREIHHMTYQYPGRPEQYNLVFFRAKISKSNKTIQESLVQKIFEQILWVTPSELSSFAFLEANDALIAALADGSI